MRGVAAMAVLILHVLLNVAVQGADYPAHAMLERLGQGYFAAAELAVTLSNGRAAVVLFFVLSGFVMGLSLDHAHPLNLRLYAAFLVKRLFRLMPAIWIAIAFA